MGTKTAKIAAGDALDRDLRRASNKGNTGEPRRASSSGFVDKSHYIVTISPIVDSGDPQCVRRAGKGNRREQYQRQNDWKRASDCTPHGTGRLTR